MSGVLGGKVGEVMEAQGLWATVRTPVFGQRMGAVGTSEQRRDEI